MCSKYLIYLAESRLHAVDCFNTLGVVWAPLFCLITHGLLKTVKTVGIYES